MESDIIERSRDIEAMERKLKDDVNRANKRIRSLEEDLNNFKNDNHGLKKENIELRNHIITLEQLLCVKEDVYAQLQDSNNRLAARTNDCDNLRSQLDGASKVSESQNDKIYELEKCLIWLVHYQFEEIDFGVERKIPNLCPSISRRY
jgi:predicted RNase H-like nuclease (RuvC/YqgF family)